MSEESSKIELNLLPSLSREFKVVRRIGAGGMGTVYEAIQTKLDRRVAIKVLAHRLSSDREFLDRFQREAKVAAAVNHPGLIQIYDFGEADGTHYSVQEFVDGENLAQRLKRTGKIPVQEALGIIRSTAEALNAAQTKGVIHRDIKPDNIMIAADGRVKVADLGLAKIVGEESDMTLTGMGLGSPHYMAPEQADDAKTVDHRSDIYALGITLITIVTGKRPFQGNSPYALIRAHAEQDLPSGADLGTQLPDGVESLIQRMGAKHPEDRYPDYSELLRDLAALQTDTEATIMLPPKRRAETGAISPTDARTSVSGPTLTTGISYSENFQTNFASAPESSTAAARKRALPWVFAVAGIAITALLFITFNRPATPTVSPDNPAPKSEKGLDLSTIDPAVKEFLFGDEPNLSTSPEPGEDTSRRPPPAFMAGIIRPNSFSYSFPLPGGPMPPPEDHPLPGSGFEELMKQADTYARQNPENYRSILNNYEQVWNAAGTDTEKSLVKKLLQQYLAELEAMAILTIEDLRQQTAAAAKRGDASRELQIWSDYPSEMRSFTHDALVWNAFTNSISPAARQLYEARFPGAVPRQLHPGGAR